MAAPLTWSRANESGAWPPEQGAAVWARRVATALLFLTAVALPCLVLYRAVAPSGVLVQPAAGMLPPWLHAAAPPHDDLVRTHETMKRPSFLYRFSESRILFQCHIWVLISFFKKLICCLRSF